MITSASILLKDQQPLTPDEQRVVLVRRALREFVRMQALPGASARADWKLCYSAQRECWSQGFSNESPDGSRS